jgi:hypothetical protein
MALIVRLICMTGNQFVCDAAMLLSNILNLDFVNLVTITVTEAEKIVLIICLMIYVKIQIAKNLLRIAVGLKEDAKPVTITGSVPDTTDH